MTSPTQQYPPWLTPFPSVIFDDNGNPVTTSTTVLFLPLTYYGPSIPLDSDWTYGGLTPPASTSTTSELTSITTSTATPSSSPLTSISSTSTSTSTATPTSLSSSVSLSSSLTSSLTSPLPSSTPSSSPTGSSNNLTRGQLIGVIVASILGFIFLFIVVLLLYLCCKGRKKRREDPAFTFMTPIDEGYEIVGPDGRTAGEGSPRHSGEEVDPFLRRSGSHQQPDPEMGERSSTRVSRVPAPAPGTGSLSSSGTSSTNHSGYGVLIERPTLNLLPSTTEEFSQRRGHILSTEELRRVEEESVLESVLPQAPDYSPLPPPRLIDPETTRNPAQEPILVKKSSQHSLFTYPDANEAATLLTARRVRAEDLASRSPPQLTLPLEDPGSSSNTGGFFSSLGLGRLSWFKNFESNSRRNSRSHSFIVTPFNEGDVEAGKALLSRPEMSETQPPRRLGFELGLGADGDRPVSSVSARSGVSVYHDAPSSLPQTPVLSGTPLAPPPRALTPSGQVALPGGWPSSSTVAVSVPPPYNVQDPTHSRSSSNTASNQSVPVEYDILDMPAPSAVAPFTPSAPSLRETASGTTGSSTGILAYPFPPGLGTMPSKTWTDASSSTTQTNNPFAVVASHIANPGISIDILEEEPPSAGEGWRSIAMAQGFPSARRTTFGQFIPPSDIGSETESLYSMRSHLSPPSNRSTGSAAASRRDPSGSGSSSSRRSGTKSGSSGHSLMHSQSIPSDVRRRGYGHVASPTFSAFGGHGTRGNDGSGSGSEPSARSAILAPPTTAYLVPERAGIDRSASPGMERDGTRALGASSPEPTSPTSAAVQLSNAPWAVGLDHNWTPA